MIKSKTPLQDNSDTSETESESEVSNDESNEEITVPYPTPPPDGDDDESLSDEPGKQNDKMVAMKKTPLTDLILTSISALNKRGGSSVAAILNHIKSTGYEVKDKQRFGKLVLKNLKLAISNGRIEQVKRSFKLTVQAKIESKALQKMKVKKEKKMNKEQKAKEKPKKKAEAKPSANVMTEKAKMKKSKPTERKTGQGKPAKTSAKNASEGKSKKISDEAAVQEDKSLQTSVKTGAKVKSSRKSIGTLANAKATKAIRAKIDRRSIKKVVAAKDLDNVDTDQAFKEDATVLAASTPLASTTNGKGKRGRKAVKS